MCAHSNCVRWAEEVVEREGVLRFAEQARLRAAKVVCSLCKQRGAAISCAHKSCKSTYHLKCALASKCLFYECRQDVKSTTGASAGKESGGGIGFDLHTLVFCPGHGDKESGLASSSSIDTSLLIDPWIPRAPTRHLKLDDCLDSSSMLLARELAFGRHDRAIRCGALTILNLGTIKIDSSTFHTSTHIFPHRFRSNRIYWSMSRPWKRTFYVFEILDEADLDHWELEMVLPKGALAAKLKKSGKKEGEGGGREGGEGGNVASSDESACMDVSGIHENSDSTSDFTEQNLYESVPIYRIAVMDDPSCVIRTKSIEEAYEFIVTSVQRCFASHPRPTPRRVFDNYGLNAYQFFGVSLPCCRHALELREESTAAVIAPPPFQQYRPVYRLPTEAEALHIQQKQLFFLRCYRKYNAEGCARAESHQVAESAPRGRRVTRILTKAVESGKDGASGNNNSNNSGAGAAGGGGSNVDTSANVEPPTEEEMELSRKELEHTRYLYGLLSAAYLENPYSTLEVKKSHIHGWGLFSRTNFDKNDMIVEYIGEKIRSCVADKREAKYEEEGVGSCYLFRLDRDDIIDATRTGGMARFINHCCEPNAYARIVGTDDEGKQKHIIIFAARDIANGEEITYDYKFPLEETKLKCYCGASKCKGTMN